MTEFSFLHAADLHLGSPFTGLSMRDAEIARRFAAAGREAFSDLVSRAVDEHVDFVVLAGDIYDGEWRDASIGLFFNREVARLDRAGIPVYLVKGNHDAESVVTKNISLPVNVIQFPVARPKTERIERLKVALHGRSFPDRAVDENYALTYPDPVPGWFNIGVLHTSCDGRPGHSNYAPCTVQDMAMRGYQYWALGHSHAYEELATDPWIVFPGNLQGRNVRELGAKGAVLVDVVDGSIKSVRRMIVDHARWALVETILDGVADESELLRRIEEDVRGAATDVGSRLLAVRIRLRGTTPLHNRLVSDRQRFSDEVQAAAHRCHEDIWVEQVVYETADTERPRTDGDALATLDPAALLEGLEQDAGLRARAAEEMAGILAKLPAGASSQECLAGDLDAYLAEARALVLGRVVVPKESA